MRIGITLTSSLEVGDEYIKLTEQVAETLAKKGYGLVYGGTDFGMMATLAESYKSAGGADLVGVMAKDLMQVTKGYKAFQSLDEKYLEATMDDRKHKIVELSDAFIILPGGYGTFEEIGTFVGGRVNKLFDKPIAFYNYNGFYDKLFEFLDEMHQKQFSKIPLTDAVFISENVDDITKYFENYQQRELVDKFVELS